MCILCPPIFATSANHMWTQGIRKPGPAAMTNNKQENVVRKSQISKEKSSNQIRISLPLIIVSENRKSANPKNICSANRKSAI